MSPAVTLLVAWGSAYSVPEEEGNIAFPWGISYFLVPSGSLEPVNHLGPKICNLIQMRKLLMLPVKSLVFTIETMTGSSLKCEEPNIPGSIFLSGLVKINSACRMTRPGIFLVMFSEAVLCQMLTLLSSGCQGMFRGVRNFPKGTPASSH